VAASWTIESEEDPSEHLHHAGNRSDPAPQPVWPGVRRSGTSQGRRLPLTLGQRRRRRRLD